MPKRRHYHQGDLRASRGIGGVRGAADLAMSALMPPGTDASETICERIVAQVARLVD